LVEGKSYLGGCGGKIANGLKEGDMVVEGWKGIKESKQEKEGRERGDTVVW
jgi:hypothetical protein